MRSLDGDKSTTSATRDPVSPSESSKSTVEPVIDAVKRPRQEQQQEEGAAEQGREAEEESAQDQGVHVQKNKQRVKNVAFQESSSSSSSTCATPAPEAKEESTGDERARQTEHCEVEEPPPEATTRIPRIARKPRAPTKAEREEHNRTHVPYQAWCEDCVFGRGVSSPHRSDKEPHEIFDADGVTFGMDYCFACGQDADDENPASDDGSTTLVLHDELTNAL